MQAPAKKRAKKKAKKRKPAGAKTKPLPPPVEMPSQPGLRIHEVIPSQADSGQHSGISSTEPRPGQPLSPESEHILHEMPGSIGAQPAGQVEPPIGIADAESVAAAAMLSELASAITFEEQDVRELLEMGFGWMAEKFESDHWRLSERQSKIIGRPAAQLATSLWVKVCQFLPEWLMRAAETTPGLAGFVLGSGIVVGPKVMQQMRISKTRKVRDAGQVRPAPAQPRAAGPTPIRQGPVGPIAVQTEPMAGFGATWDDATTQ